MTITIEIRILFIIVLREIFSPFVDLAA
jgi:hypothetical protein